MWGDAFDFDPPVSLEVAKKKCLEMGAYFTNLYTTHIHCDWRHEPVDSRFFGPGTARAARHPSTERAAFGYAAEIEWVGDALAVHHEGFDEGEPVIEWRAFDQDGQLVDSGRGARFVPPMLAVRAQVIVAGWLTGELEI
jgi:hypothetical protein